MEKRNGISGKGLTREMMTNNLGRYYYVYVLKSLEDGNKYTGYTKDLSSRFEAHQKGKVKSTKNRRPFKLIYFEGCLSQTDALKREKHLKTHYGKMFLGNRLKSYFTSQVEDKSQVEDNSKDNTE